MQSYWLWMTFLPTINALWSVNARGSILTNNRPHLHVLVQTFNLIFKADVFLVLVFFVCMDPRAFDPLLGRYDVFGEEEEHREAGRHHQTSCDHITQPPTAYPGRVAGLAFWICGCNTWVKAQIWYSLIICIFSLFQLWLITGFLRTKKHTLICYTCVMPQLHSGKFVIWILVEYVT